MASSVADLFLCPSRGTCVVTDPRPPLLGIPTARPPSFPGCDACSTIGSTGLCLYFHQALLLEAGTVTGMTGIWGGPAVCVGVGHQAFCPGGDRAPFSERGCHKAEQEFMVSLAPTNTKPWGEPMGLFPECQVHRPRPPGQGSPGLSPQKPWTPSDNQDPGADLLPHPLPASAAASCSPHFLPCHHQPERFSSDRAALQEGGVLGAEMHSAEGEPPSSVERRWFPVVSEVS